MIHICRTHSRESKHLQSPIALNGLSLIPIIKFFIFFIFFVNCLNRESCASSSQCFRLYLIIKKKKVAGQAQEIKSDANGARNEKYFTVGWKTIINQNALYGVLVTMLLTFQHFFSLQPDLITQREIAFCDCRMSRALLLIEFPDGSRNGQIRRLENNHDGKLQHEKL